MSPQDSAVARSAAPAGPGARGIDVTVRREPTYVTHVTRASRPALGNASHVLHVRFRHVAHVAWCSHRSFRQAKSSCATCVLDTSQTSAGPYIWKDWGGALSFSESRSHVRHVRFRHVAHLATVHLFFLTRANVDLSKGH